MRCEIAGPRCRQSCRPNNAKIFRADEGEPMRIYRDGKNKELVMQIDTEFDAIKNYWRDGIYISCTHASAIMFFSKEAEAKLRQELETIDKKEK